MRFRLGMVTGFATGYYLGAKAGRQRYDQINRALRRARRSDAFEVASEKAKAALDEGVEKARNLVDSKTTRGGRASGTEGAGPAVDGPAVSGMVNANGSGLPSAEIDDLGAPL